MNNDEQWDEEDFLMAEKMLNWMLTGCIAFILLCVVALVLLWYGKLI